MQQQNQNPLTEEDFNEWKSAYVTQLVLRALGMHAFDLKIGALEGYWNTTQWEERDQAFVAKEVAVAKIEFIEDIRNMDYEQLISYFKSE